MTVHITLSGPRADWFETIKEDLTEQLGYEPSNPEAMGFLMASVEPEELGGGFEGGTDS